MTGNGLHPAVKQLIRGLDLRPHPEGGWFRETWGGAGGSSRASGPAIYYLLAEFAQPAELIRRLTPTETT